MTKPASPRMALTPATVVLIILAANCLLVPVIALSYSFSPLTLALCGVGELLLLGAGAVVWFFARRPIGDRAAIAAGLGLGALWAIEIGINNFIAPPLPGRDQIDNVFWALIALGIFALAIWAAYRADRLGRGLVSGVWSGLVSGVVACGMALAVIVFAMPFILHDPLNVAEWAARGPTTGAPSMAAYFAFETLAGGLLHLTVLGVGMGAVLGLVGEVVGKGLRLMTRAARRA